jgi:hypothetical protein
VPGAYDPALASAPVTWTRLTRPVERDIAMFEPVARPTPFARGQNEQT